MISGTTSGQLRLLILCAAMQIFVAGVQAAPALAGDTDQDGDFQANDVVKVVEFSNGAVVPNALDEIYGDADQDGGIDAEDAQFVAEVIVGLRDPLPITRTNGGPTSFLNSSNAAISAPAGAAASTVFYGTREGVVAQSAVSFQIEEMP
jgi:hypothetical protein